MRISVQNARKFGIPINNTLNPNNQQLCFYAPFPHLSLTRILALSVIFFILIYQVLSHAFWIIKKTVWPCLPLEFITKIFPFRQLTLAALGYEKPVSSEGSYFYCFPSEPALLCQPKYLYPFQFALSILFLKWYHLCLLHPPGTAWGGQLPFPCCIWPKETGCHHLTEQRLLNPHSRCGCLLLLEFLWTIYPRHHQPVSPITSQGPSFLHCPLFPKLSPHPAFDVPWWAHPLCYPLSVLNLLSGSPEFMFSD